MTSAPRETNENDDARFHDAVHTLLPCVTETGDYFFQTPLDSFHSTLPMIQALHSFSPLQDVCFSVVTVVGGETATQVSVRCQETKTDQHAADGLLVIANTNSALGRQPVGPISVEIDISFRDGTVTDKEPESKHRLHKSVKDSIDHNLLIDADLTTTIGNTPDT